MKAITIAQPHAQLVALRAKEYETRSWFTYYRGPLAIHAALAYPEAKRALCRREPFASALLGNGEELPLGCIVAIAQLAAIVPTAPPGPELFASTGPPTFSESERAFGDFSPGCFAWRLENVRALEVPIPARGKQGLWDWDERQLALHAENRHLIMKPSTKTQRRIQTPAQYRQGDILIERIPRLPEALEKQAPEGGKIILAHGEVTGHAHAFDARTAAKFTAPGGAEFFEVHGETIELELPVLRRWRNQVLVQHPQFGPLEFAESDVTVRGERVAISGRFGLLRHDEHATHAVPAGFYKGGGATGTVRQREYSPEEIRNVAD